MTPELALEVLRDARELVSRPGNDFTWCAWRDADHALRELDHLAERSRSGAVPANEIALLFAPSGPMQELSLSSGWSRELTVLADRCDAALEAARHPMQATFACSLCGGEAGLIRVHADDDRAEVRRESWPSTLTLPRTATELAPLEAALASGDVRALFELDFELTPFYCPSCDAVYCSDHWDWWDVWDDEWTGWRDSVRGRCPQGHERMLED